MHAIKMIMIETKNTIMKNRFIMNDVPSYDVKLRRTICAVPANAIVKSPILMSQK